MATFACNALSAQCPSACFCSKKMHMKLVFTLVDKSMLCTEFALNLCISYSQIRCFFLLLYLFLR